jgi:hypothetical protein
LFILPCSDIAAIAILNAIILQNFFNEIFCFKLLFAAQHCQMAFCQAADTAEQSDASCNMHCHAVRELKNKN